MEFLYPPESLTLSGKYVNLIPLHETHLPALTEAAKDGELWKLWYTAVPSPSQIKTWFEKAMDEQVKKQSLPFVVQTKANNKIVGSTRYLNIEKDIRRVEIGATWYAKSVQRSGINTDCKILLLQHAFENLHCKAVEFRTHRLNEQSRRAIERLDAVQDGILRNHRIMPDGSLRDTVVYSIIESEWPTVKTHLLFKQQMHN